MSRRYMFTATQVEKIRSASDILETGFGPKYHEALAPYGAWIKFFDAYSKWKTGNFQTASLDEMYDELKETLRSFRW